MSYKKFAILRDKLYTAAQNCILDKGTPEEWVLVDNLYAWSALFANSEDDHAEKLALQLDRPLLLYAYISSCFAKGWDEGVEIRNNVYKHLNRVVWRQAIGYKAVQCLKLLDSILCGSRSPYHDTDDIASRFIQVIKNGDPNLCLTILNSKSTSNCVWLLTKKIWESTENLEQRLMWLNEVKKKGFNWHTITSTEGHSNPLIARRSDVENAALFAAGFDPHQVPFSINATNQYWLTELKEKHRVWQNEFLHKQINANPAPLSPRKI